MMEFAKGYRIAVFGLGLAWTAFLWTLGDGGTESGVWMSLVSMMPVLALAAITWFVRSRAVLLAGALAHAACIGSAYASYASSSSSTAGVALVVAPLVSLIVVVPLAALAGWVTSRYARRSRAP